MKKSPKKQVTTSTISMIIPTILALRLFLSKAVQSNSDISDFNGILLTTVEQFSESMEIRFSSYLNDENLCVSTFLDSRFKFKIKKNDMENTIKNWILHLVLSTDDNEAYSGYTSSSSAEGQEDQSESKTVSLSSLFDELVSNKPTVTNPKLEPVEAELNLETATASTTETQEA